MIAADVTQWPYVGEVIQHTVPRTFLSLAYGQGWGLFARQLAAVRTRCADCLLARRLAVILY